MVKAKSRRTRSRRRTAAAQPHWPAAPAPHRDPKVVRQAEKVFAGMGMTPYEAVVIFYKQTALHEGFPITELIPNEETQLAIWDALAGIGVIKYGSFDEMRAEVMATTPVKLRRPAVATKPRRRWPAPHPDSKVVKQAEKIFAGMGMTPADAVALFYKQTALHEDFPITELIPNEETQAAILEARAGIGLIRGRTVAEMLAEAEVDDCGS